MEIGIRCPYLNWLKHFCLWMFQQVRFASFFSQWIYCCHSSKSIGKETGKMHLCAVSCGPEHVVIVGGQGDVYSWGRGYKGERD